MKKNTIAIILLLASLNNTFMFAQNTGNQNQYDPSVKSVPTSPEVALLGRFGDIPVGHYTGTAEVSVPLYNLKIDNIEIPLTLSYHTSGIKVADEATWVGLGWSFMPEGTITQEIRGREDNISGGDNFYTYSGYNQFKNNFTTLYTEAANYRLQVGNNETNDGLSLIGPGPNDDSSEIIIRLKEKRGQPDIFTYNFYGYTGKFFYNPENPSEILFLESNNDVKFTRNTDGWVAITNKGDKFYFYAIEKSKSDQTDYTDIGYTFKVSKIELANGKTVTFSYLDESTYQQYPAEVAHLTNFTMSPSVNTSTNNTINEKKTLIGIETEDTKVEFNLVDRDDIRPYFPTTPIKRLQSVNIKSRGSDKIVKSFVFNCSYFNPTAGTTEDGYKNKRLKLDAIQEVNYDGNGVPLQNIPPYSFGYDTTYLMPSKISSSDFYGYNNASNSNSLLPDLAFFNYLDTPPYKNYGINVSYPYVPTNRYPNPAYVTTDILNNITYPTGGATAFEYESNTFTNQFIPTQQQVQSANKDISITHRGASTVPGGYYFLKSDPFKPGKTIKIKFHNTIFDGYMGPNYPQTHYDWTQMAKCKIQFHKRKTVNGQQVDTIIKEWKVDVAGSVFEQTHQEVWDEEMQVDYDNDPTAEYYVYVENGIIYNSNDGTHNAVVSSRFQYYDDSTIDKSISYGSGVRVKSIKNYENGILLSHKEYSYNDGKLIYKFEPLNLIKGATYKDQATVQTGGCYVENIAIFNDLSVNSNDFGINGNKPFGYSQVTEKDISTTDGTEKGSTIYHFTNNEFIGTTLKGIPKVDIPSNGESTLTEIFDQNQNKLSSKFNVYDNLPNTYGIYPSFYIVNTSTGPYDPTYNAYPAAVDGCPLSGISYTGSTWMNPETTSKYNFIFSPLITGKRRLKSTTETSFFGNKTLVEKTELFYTTAGNIDINRRTTSDGKIIDTDYDYADDFGNGHLMGKNMTGLPLSTEITLGSKILSYTQIKYDSPDHYLPTSALSYDLNTSNWVTEVTYDKYDSTGNLLQYTTKSGVPVSLVWGYNRTYPIAKVEGVTYDQLGASAPTQLADILSASEKDANPTLYNLQPEDAETELVNKLDIFRTYFRLADYQITTYTYDSLIGVRSITPPSGIREVYIYDTANRLKEIRENNQTGRLLKEFKYNYKN